MDWESTGNVLEQGNYTVQYCDDILQNAFIKPIGLYDTKSETLYNF